VFLHLIPSLDASDGLSTDIELQGDYGARYVKSGRWVLLAGVAGGNALSLVRRPHPLVVDVLTPALPGFMMFHTFPVTSLHRKRPLS